MKENINFNQLTLSQTTSVRLLPNWKSLQTTISNLKKMEDSSTNGLKTLWEKEKLLVTSNFSFSHSVFKRLVLEKGLRENIIISMMSITLIIPKGNIIKKKIYIYIMITCDIWI